ncbi:MAG: hypothetical protein AAFQ34_16330, partial [Pseudomonadota bacterium]
EPRHKKKILQLYTGLIRPRLDAKKQSLCLLIRELTISTECGCALAAWRVLLGRLKGGGTQLANSLDQQPWK